MRAELRPIPNTVLPDGQVMVDPVEEDFVQVVDADWLALDLRYASRGIPGSVNQAYLRKSVFERLVRASAGLPRGYRFVIFDAWRPLVVQQWLYRQYADKIASEHSSLSGKDLQRVIDTFVYPPSNDPMTPPPHTTGGAIDLGILDSLGRPIDMGGSFDDFTTRSHTDYWEGSKNSTAAANRRLLYWIMTDAGFTNLPTEWWHYDDGDAFWALLTDLAPRYVGVFDAHSVITNRQEA